MIPRAAVLVVLVSFIAGPTVLGQSPNATSDSSQFAQAPAAQRARVYSPLDAAGDGDRRAELRRREAVERQLEWLGDIRRSHVAAAVPHIDRTALPGYRAAVRRALRRGYVPPLPYPLPGYGLPVRPGTLPYYPQVQQPSGHERIWTGPNSYIYRPLYPEPFQPSPADSSGKPSPTWRSPVQPAPPAAADLAPPPPMPDDVPQIPEPPGVREL